MTIKQARKLWNYFCDTQTESCRDIYIIHLIDANAQVFQVMNIERLDKDFKFTFSLDDEVFQLWAEEINESEIFVFKQINWNKI